MVSATPTPTPTPDPPPIDLPIARLRAGSVLLAGMPRMGKSAARHPRRTGLIEGGPR